MNINRHYLLLGYAYIVLSFSVLLFGGEVTAFLGSEDGFFEYLGASAFLIAGILFMVSFWLSTRATDQPKYSIVKRLMYLLIGLMLILYAGEEISWGQRIFNVQTPRELLEVNVQGEINLHNLQIMQITTQQNAARWLFHLSWLTLMVGIPVVIRLGGPIGRLITTVVIVIPLSIGLVFLANYILWRVIYELAPRDIFLHYPEEIMESNIAVLFLVVAVYIFQALRRDRAHTMQKASVRY